MKVYRDYAFSREDFRRPVLTIGSYDGLHRGHQEIIRRVIERARERDGEALMLTFEPHPAKILRPEQPLPLITPYRKKVALLEEMGMDGVIILPFDEGLSRMSAEEFIREIIHGKIGPELIIVGYNFTFGHNREGTPSTLREWGKGLGFEVEVVSPLKEGPEVVSSTRIRELITEGRVKEANSLLGREFLIIGQVVRGKGRGRGMGFPTANIEPEQELLPARGVYAALVSWGEGTRYGVVNIGMRPTFGEEDLTVEVYVLNYRGDLYGKELKLGLVDRLRGEKAFSSAEELSRQIALDKERAEQILNRYRHGR